MGWDGEREGKWAVESRVYAEDPLRGFLPSIGPLVTYIEPELRVAEGASNWKNSVFLVQNRIKVLLL